MLRVGLKACEMIGPLLARVWVRVGAGMRPLLGPWLGPGKAEGVVVGPWMLA